MSMYRELAETLRRGRIARGLSIVELARDAAVSPRLVSEVERGQRPHVSLETALRLLALVNAELSVGPRVAPVDDEAARRARAEHRRQTWRGWKGTLDQEGAPEASASSVARLGAVAEASQIAYGLQRAYRKSVRET